MEEALRCPGTSHGLYHCWQLSLVETCMNVCWTVLSQTVLFRGNTASIPWSTIMCEGGTVTESDPMLVRVRARQQTLLPVVYNI